MKINIDKIEEIYGRNMIYNFQENIESIIENINYLRKLGFKDIYDIVETNPYLFLLDTTIFKDKIKLLQEKLGVEYIEKLEEKYTLWGEINE